MPASPTAVRAAARSSRPARARRRRLGSPASGGCLRFRDLCNLAGLFTAFRLSIAVVLPFVVPTPWILPVYLLALATDVADGAIARRNGTACRAGAAFDAWIDKILHVNLAWSLAVADRIPDVWMLAWFSREFVQLPLFFVLIHRVRTGDSMEPRTSVLGRITAFALAGSAICVLVGVDATAPTVLTGLAGSLAGLHYWALHLLKPRLASGPA